MGCKVTCMPLPQNIDFFNDVSAISSLSSTEASSCVTATGGERKECARRKIRRAYRALTIFFTLWRRKQVLLLKQSNLQNIHLTSNNTFNYFLIQLLIPECILGPWGSCCRKSRQVVRLFCAVPAEQ